jgi:signal transduction histidine kinase
MNVRARLTLIFSIIVIVLVSGISIAIYFFSADYREDDFYQRLKNKAVNTAKLLIEVEEVDADLLKRIERDNPTNLPNERIIIFNYKNEELYSSDVGDSIMVERSILDDVRLEKEIRFARGNFEALGFLFIEKFDRFTVIAAAEDIYGLGKLRNLRNILLLTFGICIVVVPISGWIYVGRMLSPISTLVNQTEEISASHLDRRLHAANTTDEFGKLTETFNSMLERLEQAFLAQKHFISNASHELRTPLTSITGEIQVTLAQDRDKEKYKDVLKSVLDDVKRLSHLSNQLLLLAQASTDFPDQIKNPVRIDEMIWQLKDDLTKSEPEYRIEIDMDASLDDEALTVQGDEQLLKVAFLNLMDNGCKYSDSKTVKVKLSSGSHTINMNFENRGIGIDPVDLETIFQPFFRGRKARSFKGHGIGLSLVQRIITLHQGAIKVMSDDGLVLFSVNLPTSRLGQ